MDNKASSSQEYDADEADREHLKKKAQQGVSNIVEAVLSEPNVKKALMKPTLEMSLFLSFLIVGILEVVNALKIVFNVGWEADLVMGSILVLLGLVYILKKLYG